MIEGFNNELILMFKCNRNYFRLKNASKKRMFRIKSVVIFPSKLEVSKVVTSEELWKTFHLLGDFFLKKIRVVFALSENIVDKGFQIDGEENALVEIKAYNFHATTDNLR